MPAPNDPISRPSPADHEKASLPIGRSVDRVQVSLRLFGADLDPDAVTRALGLAPTDAGRPGGVRTKAGGRMKVTTGFWYLDATAGPVPDSLEAQIKSLLARLPQDPGIWRQLAARWRMELFCGLFLDYWVRESALPPALLGALAERGLTLRLDIYGS